MTKHDSFQLRHIGPRKAEISDMLETLGVSSIDELIDQTIPKAIRLKAPLDLPEGMSEFEFAKHIDRVASKNELFTNFIGQGYYGTITPAVIRRNVLENPGWYTAYTPYQAEISQGRLEGLLNFQTVVSDLTGLPIANASLLDEATAAAEAALMLFHSRTRDQQKAGTNKFFIDERCFKQTTSVVKGRCQAVGMEVHIGNIETTALGADYFGALVQYPDRQGRISDMLPLANRLSAQGIKLVVATDLMALCLLTPPGEWGADVVVGSAQRFGVPMGYGGPHAGFFATKEEYKRNIPGRIIGVSVDSEGRPAMRMALQTREQHIRRDKATSNICTAQALLAIMASMYAVYHGPDRLIAIAREIAVKAASLAEKIKSFGFEVLHEHFFDTVCLKTDRAEEIKKAAEAARMNFWYEDDLVQITVDETTSADEIEAVLRLLAEVSGASSVSYSAGSDAAIPENLKRESKFLTHPVFNSFQSETDMMRYIKQLENRDISLTRSMISLGSCTMKLNAASELYPISDPRFANLHPFVPQWQAEGYREVIQSLHDSLCHITGFAAVSFQPNSGAQGEYTGLMVIRAYHESRGEAHRNVVLIPSSAHGTNPASAVMAGLDVVVVKCDDRGNIDIDDLRQKSEQFSDKLCALMVTYPSTHGVFEEGIKEITEIIHKHGGQVYMDGANMNAQVGLTNPAEIGADVCHLNLHKTFAIPHGGGGPGVGPIGVASHLVSFLPGHDVVNVGGQNAIAPVSAAPYGSALILLISYGYIKMLGGKGLTDATKFAILNANYLKAKLEKHYPVLYAGSNGRVAHEMIIDCRPFKRSAHIEVTDIAKRLIDYGFHAPTVSFPVAGTLMIEPTESESKKELDRFIQAMVSIREEIKTIEKGEMLAEVSILRNAPHTATMLLSADWPFNYSREKAAFPLPWVSENKYWPPVSRIDDAYGDRNLICACPPIEEYESHLSLQV
ncbi:MAG: aminomethyl-transferring glycine dehydrogenase [Salibacteraceae bacterium]